jgi:predicted permease
MNNFFQIAGLLRSGISLDQARAQLKLAAVQFHREFPKTNPNQQFHIEPLRDSIVGEAHQSLLMMLGAVSLVLLIACANVANLLLVRATARKREFAIRSALGAGRLRIVRQLLTESVLLSASGGVLGTALGFAGVRALLAVSPAGLPRVGESGSGVQADWRVLAFTLSVSLLTGILFGLFPALAAARTDLNSALRESSGRSGTGFRQGKTRSLLVVSEISLALVLVVGSALLIRTFVVLHEVEPGFSAQNILTMEMSLTGERLQKTAGVAQLTRNGRDRLNAIPGVELSAAGFWLPIHVGDALPFEIAGQPTDKNHSYSSRWMSITPGYLDVFHIPILRGRSFTEHDTAAAPSVALVNEALARRYWPHQSPVGRQIIVSRGLGPELEESTRTVVGVAGDTHNAGLGRLADPVVIVPIAQVSDAYTASYTNVQPLLWAVHTRSDPHQFLAAISEQLRLASGGFPVAHIRTMDEVMGLSTARERFNMLLLTIFGGVALVLAAIGIYGLMAYTVEQSSQQMGIRMALGADRSAIRSLVVWSGMKLALAGIGLGLITAFGLTRLIASFLFGVHPWDPVAFVAAPLILGIVALAAVWLPGLRASQVDPVQALRTE